MDDPSVYGDGVSVTFNDIRNTLPHLYRNTPVIYVNTKSGTKSYSFNVECILTRVFLFMESASCVDLGYSNSFKQTLRIVLLRAVELGAVQISWFVHKWNRIYNIAFLKIRFLVTCVQN